MSDAEFFSDFCPTGSLPNLRLRAEMLKKLRRFFDERGFWEVETPILSADTVVDRHLDPFCVVMEGAGGGEVTSGQWPVASNNQQSTINNPQSSNPSSFRLRWLQTSPEFAMKRLLAAGATAIYQVARVFRMDELGPLHNPEFTLVEWYRVGDAMRDGMELTDRLCETMLGRGQAEWISYAEAFERFVGVEPHRADGRELAAQAKKLDVEAPASLSTDDRDGWLDLLLVERIQPHLGVERPVLLYDFPASQAALARIRPDNPPAAERFELYASGIELANGYHELLDPVELRARNAKTNVQRIADGKPPLPEESRLLAAMEAGLPASVGVALGFDRLVMLAAGAKSIAEVVAFPFDRA